MPRVTFIRDFDYRVPGKPSLIAYKAGWSGTIPKTHVDAARVAGTLQEETADAGRGTSE